MTPAIATNKALSQNAAETAWRRRFELTRRLRLFPALREVGKQGKYRLTRSVGRASLRDPNWCLLRRTEQKGGDRQLDKSWPGGMVARSSETPARIRALRRQYACAGSRCPSRRREDRRLVGQPPASVVARSVVAVCNSHRREELPRQSAARVPAA